MDVSEKPNDSTTPAAFSPPPPSPEPTNQNVGSSADHSPIQSAYPALSVNQQSIAADRSELGKADNPAFTEASHELNDAITLICGLASSICYILIYYWVKNYWATIIICLSLSATAIYFAIKNYRKTQNVTPLEVIGISAATITIVFIGTLIVTELLIRSQINSLYR